MPGLAAPQLEAADMLEQAFGRLRMPSVIPATAELKDVEGLSTLETAAGTEGSCSSAQSHCGSCNTGGCGCV